MPKVVLSESERFKENVQSIISKYAGAAGLSLQGVAKRAQVPVGSIYGYYNHPETFNLGTMMKILEVLKVPAAERAMLLMSSADQKKCEQELRRVETAALAIMQLRGAMI